MLAMERARLWAVQENISMETLLGMPLIYFNSLRHLSFPILH